jgi:WD40 repeat protein
MPPYRFGPLTRKKAALLLGWLLGIGIAIALLTQDREPAAAPSPALDEEVHWFCGLTFAGDTLIAATRGGPLRPDQRGELRLWDVVSGRQRTVLAGHAGGTYAVAFTPNGRLVATADYDGSLRVWEVATGQEKAVLRRPHTGFYPLAFDAAGKVAWIEGDRMHHWDSATGAVSVAPLTPLGDAMHLAFSRDGRLLATVASDFTGATRLWDLPAATLRAALPGTPYPMTCASFAGSARLLAIGGGGGGVYLWNSETGQQIRALPGLPSMVRVLAFSADARRLAAGDVRGTVKIWDVATGGERGSFSAARFRP